MAQSPHSEEIQLFMVSENAVVTCDVGGIRLYHIPELSSVVSEHCVSGELPSHLLSLKGDDNRFVMKGRKGFYYNVSDNGALGMWLLGREELAGGFSAAVGGVDLEGWEEPEHEIRFVDFDERTGRISIATDRYGMGRDGEAIRIYLADLPP